VIHCNVQFLEAGSGFIIVPSPALRGLTIQMENQLPMKARKTHASFRPKSSPSALTVLPILAAGFSSFAHGAVTIDASSWTNGLGTPALSGQTSTGIVWGNNTSNNTDNAALHATIDGDTGTAGNQSVTIAIGETLSFSGSLNLQTSITNTSGTIQLRAGLYNTNGSVTTTGWLGYMLGNGTSSGAGQILERSNPNTGAYFSGTGATTLVNLPSTNGGVTLASRDLTAGLYSFSLSLTRVAGGMEVTSSLVRQSDGINFANLSTPFLDTTPQTFTFDRIGFLAGGGLDADQVTLSNLSLTVVPEPSSALLGVAGVALLLRRRRAIA
jgi:MYXO-CTERM domain-containing protein